jgi:RHS repeat-associated protein
MPQDELRHQRIASCIGGRVISDGRGIDEIKNGGQVAGGKLRQRLIASHWTQSGGTNSISDLLSDGLGSPTVRIGGTGVQAAQLYGPSGQLRWAGGTMVTTYGFTGQHSDATTGLDYYGARYYDPAAGTFTSADTVGRFNRYGYVAGNPETATDPTGHMPRAGPGGPCGGPSGGGGGGGGGGGTLPPTLCPTGVEICGGSGSGITPQMPCCQSGIDAYIERIFSDPNIQIIMEALALTALGSKVLEFVLSLVLVNFGNNGDAFISWFNGLAGSNNGSTMTLGNDLVPNQGLNWGQLNRPSIAYYAGVVTHEALELYFVQADGVPGNSFAIEYVAETFGGEVEQATADALGSGVTDQGQTDVPNESYNTWFSLRQASYPNDVHDWTGRGSCGRVCLPVYDNTSYLRNPMGLSLSMLSWEYPLFRGGHSCGNLTFSQWQQKGGC